MYVVLVSPSPRLSVCIMVSGLPPVCLSVALLFNFRRTPQVTPVNLHDWHYSPSEPCPITAFPLENPQLGFLSSAACSAFSTKYVHGL